MPKNNFRSPYENDPVYSLLQRLKSGELDPELIDKQTRKRLIKALGEDYCNYHQMAQMFGCHEKTIQRTIAEIRSEEAFASSPQFVKETAGEIVQMARTRISSILRCARGSDVLPMHRVAADVQAWTVFKQMIEVLQSIGYLPLRPKEITGNIYHHADEAPMSYEEMRKSLKDLEEELNQEECMDEEIAEKILSLKKRIDQSELAGEVRGLNQKTITEEDDHAE